ncbi:hypothetical protein [Streptomyces sp. NBC_01296]|uniref:hypothetical protein n=1 Tax=Streptomyces sp. NBC_01296 TaxID=2903816 RepID=UPI002E152BE4|nr:hypothetical protein OG299_19570 [Streptomyces sp. NBC_01296]WSW60847.1 hypothetical protein OG513_21000 [Streptomyces sp. NBC_00998]
MRAPAGPRATVSALLPALAAALVLVLTTGCTVDSAASPAGADTGSALEPPSPDVQQAYDTYWATWLAANRAPDPQDPAVERVATGPQLQELRDNLAQSKTHGQVLLGEVGHRIDGVEAPGAQTRILHDCVDLDRWLIHDAKTGQPIDQLQDKPTQMGAFTLTREKEGAPWKVSSLEVLGENC